MQRTYHRVCTKACKLKSCDMIEDTNDLSVADNNTCEYYSDSDTDETL